MTESAQNIQANLEMTVMHRAVLSPGVDMSTRVSTVTFLRVAFIHEQNKAKQLDILSKVDLYSQRSFALENTFSTT